MKSGHLFGSRLLCASSELLSDFLGKIQVFVSTKVVEGCLNSILALLSSAEHASLINNWMGTARIDRRPIEVGSKGWDWSMGSIQDTWYAGFHPRAAQTRAKRAF